MGNQTRRARRPLAVACLLLMVAAAFAGNLLESRAPIAQALAIPDGGHFNNLGFEAPAYDTGTPPPNSDFEDAPYLTATPDNHDFEDGTLSPWTFTANSYTLESGGATGSYARAATNGPMLESASFLVPDDAQTISWSHINTATGDGYALWVFDGSTSKALAPLGDASPSWETVTYNFHEYRGKTVNLRFQSVQQGIGFDNVEIHTVVPEWDKPFGAVAGLGSESTGNYAVAGNGQLISAPFDVPADAQVIVFRVKELEEDSLFDIDFQVGDFSEEERIESAFRPSGGWREEKFNIEDWQGQTVRLAFRIDGKIALDDIRMRVEIPGWDIGRRGFRVPDVFSGGPSGNYVLIYSDRMISDPTDYDRYLTWTRQLFPNPTGGNSCAGVTALSGADDSIVGRYLTGTSDCEPPGPWESVTGRILGPTHEAWSGAPVRLEVLGAGVAAFDIAGAGGHLDPELPTAKGGDPVNTSSGTYEHQHTDLFIPGRGVPTQFSRFYNSSSGINGAMGQNWAHNYEMSLATAGSSVVVRYPMGNSVRFQSVTGGFESPPGNDDTMILNGDGSYTLTTRALVAYGFSSAGRLTSIADRYGNTSTLAYNAAGQLATITDPGGREVAFTHDAVFAGATIPRGIPAPPFSNADFVAGDYSNWTATGTAFGSAPLEEAGTGALHASSNNGGEGETGTLTSTQFTAGHVLHVRLGGTTDAANIYAALVLADSSEVLATTPANNTDNLEGFKLDTRPYAGQSVRLRLVDTSTTGHLVFDEVNVLYSNLLRSIEDDLGRTVEFDYDVNGDLVAVTDVTGGVTNYTYSAHRMKTLTDSNGNQQVENFYDNASRVWKQVDAVGGVFCFYYGWGPSETDTACPGASPAPDGGRTVIVDPEGNETRYAFDEQLRTVEITDDAGGLVTRDFDDDHNLTCLTDQRGKKTAFQYDTSGNLTKIVDALQTDASCGFVSGAPSWTFLYTATNQNLDRVTDPLGRITDLSYDASDEGLTQVLRRAVAGGAVIARLCLTRNTQGLVTEMVEATAASGCGGNKTKLEYDSAGNVTAIIDPRFATAGTPKTTLQYDGGGRVTKVTNELGHFHDLTYNNRNQVLSVSNNQSPPGVVSYAYDAKGNLTRITDQLGRETDYDYDDADRLTSVVDALNQTTAYGYDGNGNRTAVTNARGKTTSFGYDALDRLSSVTDPLSRVTGYQYDAAGNLTKRTDARSLVTNYLYDSLNRLTAIDYVGSGTTDVGYGYDLVGNRTSMTDGTGTTSYVYDGLNRVTGITFPGSDEFEYAYDFTSNRTKLTYPDGKTLDYSYDAGHRLKTVTDWIDKTVTYTYNNAGYLTKTDFPNGVDAAYVYDVADRLTRVTNTGPGGLLSKHQYVLNKVGNRVKVTRTQGTDPAEVEEYFYDALYRLTSVDYADGDTTDYSYDAVGNRTGMTVNGGTPVGYTYDNADQMTAAGGVSYGYDDNGNLTSRGADSFSYDHENRLKTATVAGVLSSDGYNGDGLRMSQTVGAANTDYQWDIARGLPVMVNDETKTYTYGLDLLSQTLTSNGGRNYFNHDGLGSVSELTKSSDGTVALSFEYDVFGALRSGGGGNNWRFTGEQFDPGTDFYYLRARYYDPGTGRFLTQDPYRGLLLAPASQNRFAYVLNNPARWVDPTGLDCEEPSGLFDAVQEGFDCLRTGADEAGKAVDDGADAILTPRSGYSDLSVSIPTPIPFVNLVVGVQTSENGNQHFLIGPAASFPAGPSASYTVAPGQSVTQGDGCGLQLSANSPLLLGLTTQTGVGGLGRGDSVSETVFVEFGVSIGPPGIGGSASCFRISG